MGSTKLIQSLARGIDIMHHVVRHEGGLTLRDLCRTTGLKPPTAHNLLRTLVATRFLVRVSGPVRYRLGPGVMELVAQYNDNELIRRATVVMPELFAQLREILQLESRPPSSPGDSTIVLSRAIGGDVTLSLRVSPERPSIVERPSRAHHPYGSAVSLVFQAFWVQNDRMAYREKYPFWQFGADQWETEEKLDEFLETVRQVGYAAPDIHGPDIVRVAVPVFGRGHELVAVLGAGKWCKTSAAERRKYVAMAMDAARRIGAADGEAEV